MGIVRNDVAPATRGKFRNWNRSCTPALLAGLLILVGCVADSTLPSQNVGVLLSPQDNNKNLAAEKLEQTLANNKQQTATTPAPTLSPSVKNSLIPSNSTATPSQAIVTDVARATASRTPDNSEQTSPTVKKPKSLFGSLLNNNSKTSLRVDRPPTGLGTSSAKTKSDTQLAKLPTKSSNQSKPLIRQKRKPRIKAKLRNGTEGLPGVRIKKLFGIDTQETEEFDEPVKVASVANLARRGTHGLLLQRPGVKVGCFPRKLLRILKQVERRFGRTPIVTSGFRSASYNRRVRGARNSTHIRCLAADIQVKGVSKWTLAKYLRSIPGRGGVGTYCHTKSVHIDIGKKRAWNYCKRRRGKRKRG